MGCAPGLVPPPLCASHIAYVRGHITLLDRPGQELRCCECYSVVKNEYERLLSATKAT